MSDEQRAIIVQQTTDLLLDLADGTQTSAFYYMQQTLTRMGPAVIEFTIPMSALSAGSASAISNILNFAGVTGQLNVPAATLAKASILTTLAISTSIATYKVVNAPSEYEATKEALSYMTGLLAATSIQNLVAAIPNPVFKALAYGAVAFLTSEAMKSILDLIQTGAQITDEFLEEKANSIINIPPGLYGPSTSERLSNLFDAIKEGVENALDWFISGLLTPPKIDPLVIDLNGNGQVDLISVGDSRVNMDLDANGYAERIAWVAPSDGLLAMDRNTNGVIDGLADLFGTATTDGFIVLKTLDSNNDNKITSADAQFGKLRVWQDVNGDGIAQGTEVKTLAQHGITEISLNRTTVNQFTGGTRIAETSPVTTTTGSKSISSVYFARETLLSEWQAP